MKQVQNILQASLLWRMLAVFSRWCGKQWESSRVVQAFLAPSPRCLASSQSSVFARLWELLHRLMCFVYDKLHLDRLTDGSIFRWAWLWCALPVVLSPFLPTMAAAALGAAGWLALLLELAGDRKRKLAFSPINKYILLYAAVYLIATLLSVTPKDSLPVGALTVYFILFSLVVENCTANRRQLEGTVQLMVLAAAGVSLYGLYQYIFRAGYQSAAWVDSDMFSSIQFRVPSTLQNPNMLGLYLILLIPLGGALLLTAQTWKKRGMWLACCALMCLCMLVTFSRGAYLGLLCAGLVFFVLINPRLLLLAPFALLALYFVLPETVIERFASIGNLTDQSTSYRVYIWGGVLRMLSSYWLSGIGPGEAAFNTVYPIYSYEGIVAPHSHNLFLQITCDAGICALIVFLFLLFWYFKHMCSALHQERQWKERIYLIAFLSGVCGFMVQAMTDYAFYNYRVMFLFWAYLALGVTAARFSLKKEGAL